MAGTACDRLVDLADIMPTVLDLAGVQRPEGLDGVNLLEEKEATDDERVFHGNCCHTHFTTVDGDWKYLWDRKGGGELLFNLADDPYETHDFVRTGEQPERLAAMRDLMGRFWTQRNAQFATEGAMVPDQAVKTPAEVARWPGFHSTVVPCDVLH